MRRAVGGGVHVAQLRMAVRAAANRSPKTKVSLVHHHACEQRGDAGAREYMRSTHTLHVFSYQIVAAVCVPRRKVRATLVGVTTDMGISRDHRGAAPTGGLV